MGAWAVFAEAAREVGGSAELVKRIFLKNWVEPGTVTGSEIHCPIDISSLSPGLKFKKIKKNKKKQIPCKFTHIWRT